MVKPPSSDAHGPEPSNGSRTASSPAASSPSTASASAAGSTVPANTSAASHPAAPESKGARAALARQAGAERVARAEGPLIQYSEHPAGRETMAAIAEGGFDVMRPLQTTNPYGDRISNAPGALSPRVARALDDRPAISVEVMPAGRDTFAAIARAVADEAPAIEVDGRSLDDFALDAILALEVEQVLTFLVRAPLALLDSPRAKERLVRERLARFIAAHVPGGAASTEGKGIGIAGVDVRPWHEPGVLLVRVRLTVPVGTA